MPKFLMALAGLAALALPACGHAQDARSRAVDAIFAAGGQPGPGYAVGIYREGKIVYAHAHGLADMERGIALTPHSVFDVASVSKQFTAFAIALLVRDGKLALDDDIRKYLPWVPDFGRRITIADLIHHQNGLKDDALLIRLAGRDDPDFVRQFQVVNLVKRQRTLNFPPETQFEYNNTGYVLLAEIVRAVTGQTLRQFAGARIFAPLGMTHTHFKDDARELIAGRALPYERDGKGGWRNSLLNQEIVGPTALYTTVDDLLKWVGNFDRPVVGDKALMETIGAPGALRDGTPVNYGYGLWHYNFAGHDAVMHEGQEAAYRSTLVYFPKEHFGVVILANQLVDMGTPVEKIVRLYLGQGRDADKVNPSEYAVRTPAPAELNALAGHYLNPIDWAVDLVVHDGKLYSSGVADGEEELTLHDKDVFSRGQGSGARYFAFDRDGSGRIVGFRPVGGLGGQGPSIFTRAEPVSVSAADLAKLAGEYRAPELDVTYDFTVEDGRLTARSIWSDKPVRFTPVAPDRYDSDSYPMGAVEVRRDAKGAPTRLVIVAGGLIGTVLDRMPKSPP